jgi:hypothetical protein
VTGLKSGNSNTAFPSLVRRGEGEGGLLRQTCPDYLTIQPFNQSPFPAGLDFCIFIGFFACLRGQISAKLQKTQKPSVSS